MKLSAFLGLIVLGDGRGCLVPKPDVLNTVCKLAFVAIAAEHEARFDPVLAQLGLELGLIDLLQRLGGLKRGRDKGVGMQEGELLEDVGCLRGWRVRLPGWHTKRGIGHNFSSCRSLPLATASLSLLPLLS